MASIAPILIGCIDYLAYGTIFTCAMFCPKINLMFFFTRKAGDEPAPESGMVGAGERINRQKNVPATTESTII